MNITIDASGISTSTASALQTGFEAIIEQLRKDNGETQPVSTHGWTAELVLDFAARLQARHGHNQGAVIRAMLAAGGRSIDRPEVVSVCEFSPDRLLNGFTKPVKGALRSMIKAGLLPQGADDDKSVSNPLRPDYAHGPGKATGFFMDAELADVFRAALDLA